ncbi:MAG TPA: YhjD/YihY/BrkB family envelope integrity protein, partial [Pirellulales bacterium]
MSLASVNWWKLLSETSQRWMEDKALRLAAALSFYSALSIAPLLVLLLRVVGYIFGDEAATGEIKNQTQSLIGPEGADAIQAMIQSANQPESGTIATVLSLATLLFGASGVFAELQDSLNTVWKVQPK